MGGTTLTQTLSLGLEHIVWSLHLSPRDGLIVMQRINDGDQKEILFLNKT